MTRRHSLREYQAALTRRLQEARSVHAPAKLGMAVGTENWLINLADAREVLPVPELTPVPTTQYWFRGLAKVRGNLYGVVDLAAFLGGAPIPLFSSTRLVLPNDKFKVNCGILVAQMLGLKHTAQLRPRDLNGHAVPWVCAAYQDADEGEWKELDLRQLMHHPDFLRVGIDANR
jgi:twitching motility protein PilI